MVAPVHICSDARHHQPALFQLPLELVQEGADVVVSRIMVKHGEGQAVVPAVVHDREDAERAVVDLVDRQVAAASTRALSR